MKALLLICSLVFLTGCPAARAFGTGAMRGMSQNIDRANNRQAGMSAYEIRRLEIEQERLEEERKRNLYEKARILGVFR